MSDAFFEELDLIPLLDWMSDEGKLKWFSSTFKKDSQTDTMFAWNMLKEKKGVLQSEIQYLFELAAVVDDPTTPFKLPEGSALVDVISMNVVNKLCMQYLLLPKVTRLALIAAVHATRGQHRRPPRMVWLGGKYVPAENLLYAICGRGKAPPAQAQAPPPRSSSPAFSFGPVGGDPILTSSGADGFKFAETEPSPVVPPPLHQDARQEMTETEIYGLQADAITIIRDQITASIIADAKEADTNRIRTFSTPPSTP